jgi:hypothetical protein
VDDLEGQTLSEDQKAKIDKIHEDMRARIDIVVKDQIDLKQLERQGTRPRAPIVKASREGCWDNVKASQRLLTYSFRGNALAVKRLTRNESKWTSGVDNVLWSCRNPNSSRSHRHCAGDTGGCRYGGCIFQIRRQIDTAPIFIEAW